MATEPRPAPTAGAETRSCSDERWRLMWSHRDHLLRVARRRSVSVEDAEDAVHEAMLRAMENPRLDHDRLAAWLTTVTIRLCVDRHRQVDREAEVGSRTTRAMPVPAPVEDVVCDRDEANWVARRSGELPGRQAEALWLKSEDLDVGQVARRMGLSYRTVESLLARARRTLRNSLAGTLAVALWLCGRGRPRQGGAAQSAAVVSTAATLTVLGIGVPGVYDGTAPPPPRAVVERADGRGTVAPWGPPGPVSGGRVPSGAAGPYARYGAAGAVVSPWDLVSLPALRVAGDGTVAVVPPLTYVLGLPGLPSVRSVPAASWVRGLTGYGAAESPGAGGEPTGTSLPGSSTPTVPHGTGASRAGDSPDGGGTEDGGRGSGSLPEAPDGAGVPPGAGDVTGVLPGGEDLPDVPSGAGEEPGTGPTVLP